MLCMSCYSKQNGDLNISENRHLGGSRYLQDAIFSWLVPLLP